MRGPGQDGCSADASCPISYSQHSAKQSRGTQADTHKHTYAHVSMHTEEAADGQRIHKQYSVTTDVRFEEKSLQIFEVCEEDSYGRGKRCQRS